MCDWATHRDPPLLRETLSKARSNLEAALIHLASDLAYEVLDRESLQVGQAAHSQSVSRVSPKSTIIERRSLAILFFSGLLLSGSE